MSETREQREHRHAFHNVVRLMATGAIQRVSGVRWGKERHATKCWKGFDRTKYAGLPCDSLERLVLWIGNNEKTKLLYAAYKAGGYNLLLRPTLHRLTDAGGYVVGNIDIITFSENARLAALRRVEVNRARRAAAKAA